MRDRQKTVHDKNPAFWSSRNLPSLKSFFREGAIECSLRK